MMPNVRILRLRETQSRKVVNRARRIVAAASLTAKQLRLSLELVRIVAGQAWYQGVTLVMPNEVQPGIWLQPLQESGLFGG